MSRPGDYFRMRRTLDAPIIDAPLPTDVTPIPFGPDTARHCRDLMNRVYAEGFGDPVAFDTWWPWLTSSADFEPRHMYVAAADGRTIAFCHCWADAFIKDVVTDPAFRGRGIGTALITMALVACKERGASFVDLKTDVENVRAQSLYRRLGFDLVERAER